MVGTDPRTPAPAPDLREVRALVSRRDWTAVADLLGEVPAESLREEPELGFHYADACHRTGQPERAREIAESLESRVMGLGDRGLLLALLNVIGIADFGSGDLDRAEARFAALLEYAAAWDNEEFAARAANNLGIIANIRGRREAALTWYERALASYSLVGNPRGLAQTHHNVGIAYRDLGFVPEAEAHLRRAMELARSAESEDVIALAEAEIASLRALGGDGVLAESLARRALERFERLGDPLGRAEAMRVLGVAARTSGRESDALRRLDDALAIAREHSEPLLTAEIQRDRARILSSTGETEAAITAYLEAGTEFEALGAAAEAAAARAHAGALQGG